jgi:hypothetical protein
MLEIPLVDTLFDCRIPYRVNSCWMHPCRYTCCNDGKGKDVYVDVRGILARVGGSSVQVMGDL